MAIDILKGSISKNLFHTAWPPMVAMLFHVGFNIVDAIFVGRLGPNAIAAVSIVFPVIFFMFAIASGLGIGTTSLIARYLGANRLGDSRKAATHSVVLAIALSIILTAIGLFFGEWMYGFLNATPEIIELATIYGNWIYWFTIFMFMSVILGSIHQGEGNMKIPMIAMVSSTILNIILDPILIFGLLGFPALGVEGAAIATVISRFVSVGIVAVYFWAPYVKVRLQSCKLKILYFKEIIRVALPSSINQVIMSFGFLLVTKIVGIFGPLAIAAYGIGIRIETLVILPILGISTAVITIVGQSVGAKDYARAEKTTWYGMFYSIGIVVVIISFFLIFPRAIFSVFTQNPQVIEYGYDFLRIISYTYIFAAMGINISGAFQGSGHAVPPVIITIVRLIIIAIPAALFFAFTINMGLPGVWLGILTSAFITGIWAIIWFRLGTWKKRSFLKN